MYLIKSLKYKEYTHGCRKENCVACSGGRFSGLIWVKEKDAIDCPHFQGFGFRFFWGELELWMTDAHACVDLWGPPRRFMLRRIALTDEHRYNLGISEVLAEPTSGNSWKNNNFMVSVWYALKK